MSSSPERSALDLGLELAKRFRAANVPYALGGALALNASGILRATRDVDVNIFLDPRALAPVFQVLGDLGIPVDARRAEQAANEEGMFVVWDGLWRIDVFTPSIDFSWKAAQRIIIQDVEGEPVAFLSPETLAVFKLLFFRGKDLVDLEQLVAIRDDLDLAWIRTELVGLMGEEDPRVAAWDRISSGRPA